MKVETVLIAFIMIFNSINGQDLNGKYILKEIDSGNEQKSYPGFQLLEIYNDKIDIYTDFSLKEKSTTLRMSNGDLINSNNEKTSEYKIINENHIKWIINGKSNDKDVIFEFDFYRLFPTITTLNKEDIEKLTFILTENGNESEIVFNKELWDKQTLKQYEREEGEKKLIENIDSTFFISIYSNGKRNSSIPIKEVSTELLKLYAIPAGPMEIIAYRKRVKYVPQHRITANSGQFAEKCYFRDLLTNNKTDKNASLLHATCVIQDRCSAFKRSELNVESTDKKAEI